jgi:protocatechuate 3,4-dioxygenase beta subunit
MKRGQTVPVVMIAAIAAYAQHESSGYGAGAEDLTQTQGAISGTITAADSRAPLKKVALLLVPADRQPDGTSSSYSTTTNAEGAYELKGVQPGRYRLWASRNGYVRHEYGAKRPGRVGVTLHLRSGERLSGIDLALFRQTVITGKVIDDEGEPLPHAFVQALRHAWIRGQKQLAPAGSGQTDDQGQYRIYDLPPGKYLVSAAYRGDWQTVITKSPSGADDSEESYVTTYYPGVTDASNGVLTETSATAGASGVDIHLQRVRTAPIRGRVIGDNPSRYEIVLMRRGSKVWAPMDMRRARVDANGAFEIRGVAPGSYTLAINSHDGDQGSSGNRMPLEVGSSPVEDLALPVSPGTELSGRVTAEDGSQIQLASLHVVLSTRDNPFFGGSTAGPVSEDGSFTVPFIAGDQMDVKLRGLPPGLYVKLVRYGQEDVLANGLNLSQTATEKLEIVVSSDAAKLQGVVLNQRQQPVGGATVVIAPGDERSACLDFRRTVTTDASGRYAIDSLPPGKYRLFAFEDLEQGAGEAPEYLEAFDRYAEGVDLDPKATAVKQLLLIEAGAAP